MPQNVLHLGKFAVLKRSVALNLLTEEHASTLSQDGQSLRDVLKSHSDEEGENNALCVEMGALLKIFQQSSKDGQEDLLIVQILDYVNHLAVYDNLYTCSRHDLLMVEDGFWPFIISMIEGERRLEMLQNVKHCKWLQSLRVNNIISCQGEVFNQSGVHYDCIIRYIGPVLELHPVGYFFGLELLHLSNGTPPKRYRNDFCRNYINCDPDLSIFTTGNWLQRLEKGPSKKFSPKDFITDTLEKVKTAIAPTQHNGDELFNMKKVRKSRELPSAQFYANLVDDMDAQLNLQDNEEFQKSVEHYEKTLERRSQATIKHTPTQPPPVGILKTKRLNTIGSSTGSEKTGGGGGRATKDQRLKAASSGFIAFGDKDIVVIDNAEIDEITKHGADIIVVDKARDEVDLAELLGANWPKTAGNAAIILNQKLSAEEKGSKVNQKNKSAQTSAKQTQLKTANSLHSLDNCGAIPPSESGATVPTVVNGNASNEPEEKDKRSVVNLLEVPNSDLGIGSMVEVNVPNVQQHLYGVIRWVGVLHESGNNRLIKVGVELEDDHHDKQLSTTDGVYNNIQLFQCPEGRGLFVLAEHCQPDRRFALNNTAMAGVNAEEIHDVPRSFDEEKSTSSCSNAFGNVECPIIRGAIPPLKCLCLSELEELCGKFKGIQGHHNSCYLDVTLFSMFAFTPVFDAILFRPPEPQDISHYTEVQTVLREEIVNPLRKHMFVRADRVMKLRQLLDKLSSVSGLTSEEKDPEEFLNCILSQILRAEPFLKLSSEQDAYYYQLFVEKDERLSFPSVQQLFEQSFYTSDIKLKEVPSCLIIQMPRFGKNYKMYSRILPSQVLDVTDIIEDSPRQCSVCGILAEYECRNCYGVLQTGSGLESTAFCAKCIDTAHMHSKRANHVPRKLSVPQDFRAMAEHMNVPRLYMELFAVVCIETSHYVTFLKAGSGPDAPWCFFDSMADRKGELNGYNIPEIKAVPDIPKWLSDEGASSINEAFASDKALPEHAKRLFCDAYMCMYQSTDVMMYR